MNNKTKILISAFTLIELLIVIAIIGILVALATASYTSAQRQARDTARKSDLAQYRTSLESYANKNNGTYPIFTSKVDPSTNLCTPLGLTCPGPADPKPSTNFYSYITDANGMQYVLWAKLENPADSRFPYWVVCSNGTSGTYGSNPISGACPL